MNEQLPDRREVWIRFTHTEYYKRVWSLMVQSGLGEGDSENILANVFDHGWMTSKAYYDLQRETP